MMHCVFIVLLFAATAWGQEPTQTELQLQREVIVLKTTVAQMQREYAALLDELGKREAQRLEPALRQIESEIKKKKEAKPDGS